MVVPKRKPGKRPKSAKASNAAAVANSILSVSPLPEVVLPASQWAEVVQAIQGKAEKAIRVRRPASMGDGHSLELPFEVDPVPWFDAGQFARHTYQPGRYLQHAAGAYFVQDAGSMLALRLLDAQPDEFIADVCAAPGGKATSILEIVGPGAGFLLANEPIRGRVAALQWTLGRIGFSRYATSQYDVDQLAEKLPGCFDKVLVDAPCSGQTLVGRGKQSVASFDPAQVEHSAARQKRIIRAAAELVRPGGRLVYSTCTFAIEENERVAQHLISEDGRWQVVDVPGLRQWASPLEPGGYRLWPHRDRCAGAYAICLELGSASEIEEAEPLSPKPTACFRGGDRLPGEVGDLVEQAGSLKNFLPIAAGRQWYAVPNDAPGWLEDICFVASEIAYQPAKVWLPAHALGLRRESSWQPRNLVELDDSDAQRFLQGLTLDPQQPGWSVVRWRGHPMGWIHSNQQRANNSLPQAARLPYIAPTT